MKYTELKVIPMPKEVKGEVDGEFESVSVLPRVHTDSEKFKPYIETFSEYAEKLHGIKFDISVGGIMLYSDPVLAKGEYRLITDNGMVNLYAYDSDGATNALSTVLQLIRPNKEGVEFPVVSIKDKPDCEYRSLMVDLAREWHKFENLLEYVDLCYLYKIKYLHLHFIDTQSYTLPSDVFPGVSTVGRHYTKEEIKVLNEYALARNIELIPEFEVPGHAAAMVNAYPELFANTPCDAPASEVDPEAFKTEFANNIICVGKPGVMDNIRKLMAEVMDMFPNSRYIHIGGDEAEINDWGNCKDCLRYMKEHRINGVREIYTHFTKLATDMVLEMGRTPIVWEGFPKEGNETISRDVLVIAWESYYHVAYDLVKEGFNIVNASWKPVYITPQIYWSAEDIMAWNIYSWSHWWEKSEAHLNPIHLAPSNQVKGGMLCSWECTYDEEIEHIRENLAAVSERTWNIRRYAEDNQFREKIEHILPMAKKFER